MSRLSNLARRIDDAVFDDDRLVEDLLPADLRDRYSVTSYRSAAAVLQQRAPEELAAIIRVLRQFTISRDEIRAPGGNRMSATTRFAQYAAAENFHPVGTFANAQDATFAGAAYIHFRRRLGKREIAWAEPHR